MVNNYESFNRWLLDHIIVCLWLLEWILKLFQLSEWKVDACLSPPLDLLVITLRKTFQRGFRFSITWPSQLDTLRPDTRLAGRCVTWTPMERPFVHGANDVLLSVCQSVDSWLGCPSWRRHPVPVPGGPQVNSWTSILVTNTSDKDLMPVNLKLYVCVSVLYFSVHRYEQGSFWPHLPESDSHFIGTPRAAGRNINLPWNKVRLFISSHVSCRQSVCRFGTR